MIVEIRQQLENSEHIAIFGHEHVDGDALGAMLGLGTLLEKQGKTVSYFTPHEASKIFGFLSDVKKVQTSFDYSEVYDLFVFVDFSDYKRIGIFTKDHESYFDKMNKIIIDHHLESQIFDLSQQNLWIHRDVTAMSTCEIIFELTYSWWKDLYDSNIATLLYTGISTDTGNFRYDEGQQTIRLFDDAKQLISLGADKHAIIMNIFRNKSYASVQFMVLLLQRMQRDGTIISSWYTEEELRQFDLEDDEADHALYIMQDIGEIDLVVLMKRNESIWRCSLRGRGSYNCSTIAKEFGGGGHFNAAGFRVPATDSKDADLTFILKKVKEVI